MKKALSEIKKHVMTGISFMIPIVVAGGILQAIGVAIYGTGISQMEGETLMWYVWKCGNLGMSLVVPVICAAIAYSIADRPAIAPGLILGFVCTYINAGFIGGIAAAFLVGYFILLLKKYLKVLWRHPLTIIPNYKLNPAIPFCNPRQFTDFQLNTPALWGIFDRIRQNIN